MQLVSRASDTSPYGFRKRHETVGAFWQALLILTIVGSIVPLIRAPVYDAINIAIAS